MRPIKPIFFLLKGLFDYWCLDLKTWTSSSLFRIQVLQALLPWTLFRIRVLRRRFILHFNIDLSHFQKNDRFIIIILHSLLYNMNVLLGFHLQDNLEVSHQ
jgi:hypothetical protein